MVKLDIPMWMRILRYLIRYDSTTETIISKDLDATYSHVIRTLNIMKNDGYVLLTTSGRTKVASLTAKGKEDAQDIDKIFTRRNIPVTIQRGVR